MKLKKIISINLILIMSFYILLSCFEDVGNTAFAGQYISMQEAEGMCPGISGLVNNLVAAHPGYNFQFYNTGIEWNEAIIREYQGHGGSPKNLFNVNSSYSGMWHCPVCGNKSYDNGSLCCASTEALRYMMDPRNSITEDSVFQFKSLETPDVSYEDVVRVIAGTFLDHEECARAIVEASQAYNINGYYLVAKMLTEHGRNGSTLSNGVGKDGVIYYNFFNIGAYGNSVQAIITNGTNYAASAGWNSKRASILGGAQIVRDSYVGKGQNTCYYQKFNVVNEQSGLFSHQYAQNILSAENEGRKFKGYYTINGQIVGNHTFIIPLYVNMPRTAEARPNSSVVNTIGYETAVVTANGGLKVRSRQDITSAHIGSIPQNSGVKVLIRAATPNGNDGFYWDLIISDSGICGYVARNYIQKTGEGSNSGGASSGGGTPSEPVHAEGEAIKIVTNLFEISATTTYEQAAAFYPGIVIKDYSGNPTNVMATGYTATDGVASFYVIKKGDVNGDGNVNILDAVALVNHVNEQNMLSNPLTIEAGKVNGNSSISVTDVISMLNYINEKVDDIKIK